MFTVAILYLLLNIVGAQALKQALSRTDWTWLIGMYAMTLCFIVINSAMLKQVLEKVGLEVSLRRVALANSLSTMYSLILPSDALEFMYIMLGEFPSFVAFCPFFHAIEIITEQSREFFLV